MKDRQAALLGFALTVAALLVVALFLRPEPSSAPSREPDPELAALRGRIADLSSRLATTDDRLSEAEARLGIDEHGEPLTELGARSPPDGGEPAADPPRAAPRLELGAPRADVVERLGPPEAEVVPADAGEHAELRYYAEGIRVELDRDDRLAELELLGRARSTEAGPTYRPVRWTVDGVTVGMTAADVARRLGEPGVGLLADDDGRYDLHYPERDLLIRLGPPPDHRVESFRLGREGLDPSAAEGGR